MVLAASLASCAAVAAPVSQRDSIPDKLAFDWAVGFQYVFDNFEYSKSHEMYDCSDTQHGVRLTPEAGIAIPQGKDVLHRVRVGLDLFKEAGSDLPVGKIFNEVQLYYGVSALLGNGGIFEANAGCFSRKHFDGCYVGPAFDRFYLFSDSNVDGMLFKYRNKNIRAELGLDWLGKFADEENPSRRERFQILTSGDWRFAGPFHLLWTGMFYHYACSLEETGVVDNHLINPMLEWRPNCWLDKLSIQAGGIFTYQWDRSYDDVIRAPMGFYSIQEFTKWQVSIVNRVYYGSDLQYYYDKYGPSLYPGKRMFHTRRNCASFSDEVALSYFPRITGWLELGVEALFSFGSPDAVLGTKAYRGCRQLVTLKLDLERFGKR